MDPMVQCECQPISTITISISIVRRNTIITMTITVAATKFKPNP